MMAIENVFTPFINQKGFVVLDGAMATELELRGANLNHTLWSAKLLTEDPGLIKQVHYDYLMAGADVVTTASYQASFDGFAKHGYTAQEAIALMQLSVQLAFDARADAMKMLPGKQKPLIAASVGPYGASLADGSEYRGNYGVGIEELKSFHRRRMEVLVKSGADILACETIPCIDEAIALNELLSEFSGVQAWISFSCKNDKQISSGENFADAIKLLSNSTQVVAVGINCTAPQYLPSLIKIGAQNTNQLILVYPNKGEVWDAANKCWLPAGANHTHFLDEAKGWFTAGAKIIGGCCKTTPADIRQLEHLIDYR